MEQFLRYGGENNLELYNCSALPPEEWTRRDGEPHQLEGMLSVTWGILLELMYIPCIMVLSNKDFLCHSCFKIMLVLGIVDMSALVVNSLITGVLLYEGAVFCSHPTLIYVSGSFGLSLWCISCLLCLVLVFNRLLDIWKPDFGHRMFEGNRTYFIIMIPIAYGLYYLLFTPPVIFTSKYHAWFFDPFVYPNRTLEYQNLPHTINNFGVVGITVLLYAFFVLALRKRLQSELMASSGSVKAHKQIFLQSSIICMFTTIASVLYVLMNFIEVPVWLVKLTFHIGCPAFIYLFANKTIQRAALSKLMKQPPIKPFTSMNKVSHFTDTVSKVEEVSRSTRAPEQAQDRSNVATA